MSNGTGGELGTFQAAGAEDKQSSQDRIAAESAAFYASPDEVRALCRKTLNEAGDYFPYVGVLLDAIARGAKGPATIVTRWGGGPEGKDIQLDPEKHALYSNHIRAFLHDSCPWLTGLLDAASATLLVAPGAFYFLLAHRPGFAFEVPELSPLTKMTPWVEPGETMH